MEEIIINEVLEAQKKYFDSKRDYEQKAEKFLKAFLEEHDGMFDMEENEDKFGEVPYVYYSTDDCQVLECIFKDIYLKNDNIYADILARFRDGEPFEELFEGIDWSDLFHRGDLDDFISELTNWQDDEDDEDEDDNDDYDEDEEDYDEDDEDYDEDDEDYDEDDNDEEEDNCIADKNTAQNNIITYEATEKILNKWAKKNTTNHKFADGKGTMTLKKGVTAIGKSAFFDCSALTSINIPDSVTKIGSSAFSRCIALTSIVVAEGNKTYDSRNNCNAIIETASNKLIAGCKNTIIPDSVTSIGDYAFSFCRALTSIDIPDSVTSIEDYAFSDCSALTSINIPNSVTSIGSHVFLDCIALTSIVVAEGNKTYDSRNNCNAIIETASNKLIAGFKNTIIPDSVTSIGNEAFYGCRALTSINIPDSVTSIGEYAFDGCSALTEINIPDSVTEIGMSAFSYCRALTSINIPDSVTEIDWDAFNGCSALTEIKIPDKVTSIGDNAFRGCRALTSINIPDSVTEIGKYAFQGCSALTEINLPDSVTSIGSFAFDGCSALTSINIPDSVTRIDNSAFVGCDKLPDDVKKKIKAINKKAM